MRTRSVVVRRVLSKHPAQVPLTEDQHPVGDLGPDRQYQAFGNAVRPRTPRRDLGHFDARVRRNRVERCRELTSPVADEEPEPGDVIQLSQPSSFGSNQYGRHDPPQVSREPGAQSSPRPVAANPRANPS
jgi:hypothetical protein